MPLPIHRPGGHTVTQTILVLLMAVGAGMECFSRVTMSMRRPSLPEARPSLAAMLAVLAMALPTAGAQNVSGSLAVSATILPPAARQTGRLTTFRMARDGIAQPEAPAPLAGSVPQIVKRSVSSSAKGSVLVRRTLMDATSASLVDSTSHNMTVRIHYLIVSGT